MVDRDFSDTFHPWTIEDNGYSLHHDSGVVIRLRPSDDEKTGLSIASIDLPPHCDARPDRLLGYINSAYRFWRNDRGG